MESDEIRHSQRESLSSHSSILMASRYAIKSDPTALTITSKDQSGLNVRLHAQLLICHFSWIRCLKQLSLDAQHRSCRHCIMSTVVKRHFIRHMG